MFSPGLGSILFAINIDNPDLNSIKPATGLDNFVTLSTSAPSPKLPYLPEPDPQPVIGGETLDRGKKMKNTKQTKTRGCKQNMHILFSNGFGESMGVELYFIF